MKRWLTMILALCLCLLPIFPVAAEATETTEATEPVASMEAETAAAVDGDWEYSLNSGIATITKYNGTDKVVTVPKMFGNYLVTTIGADAFKDNTTAQQIILHDKIISIGDHAFSGCVALKSIEIPQSVTYLGYGAFASCSNVKTITINAKNLQDCARYSSYWRDCRKPFWGVGAATNGVTVTFGDGCTRIPAALFYCYDDAASKANIKTVVMADSVTTIADHAFDGCDTIETVRFSENLTSIGIYAFSVCSNLKNAVLPDSLQTLSEGVFKECISLQSVKVNANTIGNYVYKGCVGLKSIVLGENVSYLGYEAFGNCTNVESVTINAKQLQDCARLDGYGYGHDIRKPFYAAGSATDGMTVTFAEGCTRIPAFMFYCYEDAASKANIKTVVMADSVAFIANSAFDYCDTIETVRISRNVQSIGQYAFSGCTGLKRVDFMGNAPEIDNTAFSDVTTNCYYRLGYNWKDDNLKDYGGDITWNALVTTPEKPNKIVNVVSGIHVYWDSINGVNKYGLWRSDTGKNGEYKWIGNPAVPHFTDTEVQSGKTYYYKVTMIHPVTGEHSDKSEAIGITYVATPDITSRFNKSAGITLGWNKVQGATGYAIYRKSYYGSDDWVRIATIKGNSTFTWQDTTVKERNGEVYKYTIRALAGSGMQTLSGCRNTGRTMARLTSRTLNSAVQNGENAIKCNWTTSSAVTGYEVRFMVDGKVYKTFTVGNYKTGVKTFTGLESGHTYKIQVRSYLRVGDMGFYSAWSTAKYVTL